MQSQRVSIGWSQKFADDLARHEQDTLALLQLKHEQSKRRKRTLEEVDGKDTLDFAMFRQAYPEMAKKFYATPRGSEYKKVEDEIALMEEKELNEFTGKGEVQGMKEVVVRKPEMPRKSVETKKYQKMERKPLKRKNEGGESAECVKRIKSLLDRAVSLAANNSRDPTSSGRKSENMF